MRPLSAVMATGAVVLVLSGCGGAGNGETGARDAASEAASSIDAAAGGSDRSQMLLSVGVEIAGETFDTCAEGTSGPGANDPATLTYADEGASVEDGHCVGTGRTVAIVIGETLYVDAASEGSYLAYTADPGLLAGLVGDQVGAFTPERFVDVVEAADTVEQGDDGTFTLTAMLSDLASLAGSMGDFSEMDASATITFAVDGDGRLKEYTLASSAEDMSFDAELSVTYDNLAPITAPDPALVQTVDQRIADTDALTEVIFGSQ